MPLARRTALVAALSALATAQTAPKLTANCEDVVIFMARGNDAPYQDSRTFPFVTATCEKLRQQGTSCDFIEIQFDVTLGGPYCDQVAEGASNGIRQITAFNQRCPNTKIVVNGYSEGAHVVGDVLGGPGGCTGSSTGIDNNSAAGRAIAAALLWGDVRHTANQPYNVLNGANRQKAPRTGRDLQLLNRYSSVLRSYCAAGDPVCADGTVVADHLNYFQLYTDDASSWVVSMINRLSPTSSSVRPTPTATITATSVGSPSATATSSAEFPGAPAPSGSIPGYGVAPSPVPYTPNHGYNVTYPPFPSPVHYVEACVVIREFEYVYAVSMIK